MLLLHPAHLWTIGIMSLGCGFSLVLQHICCVYILLFFSKCKCSHVNIVFLF